MFTGIQGWTDGVRALLDVDAPEYPDALIQTFIKIGEERLNRDIRTLKTEKAVSDTIANGEITLPADFQQMRSVFAPTSTKTSVEMVSPDEFYDQRKNWSADNPNPEVCMIVADKLKFYPAGNADIDLIYYAKVPSITSLGAEDIEDQVTVFTEEYSDALYFAAGLGAAPYMLDDVRIPIWEQTLSSILTEINRNKQLEHYGSAPLKRRLRVMG